ncbi:hypothetical protein J2TS6_21090 [Paenibacillus albilobatus]|uniref:Uncharacterized protein n=1 Tax=Paenibacillus albilobatus TaxID=2716884 RepID=A0A919XGH1_9BACL|nr:hypothetical protein J2TS6_21090 [Paenibacillus albilobatus]
MRQMFERQFLSGVFFHISNNRIDPVFIFLVCHYWILSPLQMVTKIIHERSGFGRSDPDDETFFAITNGKKTCHTEDSYFIPYIPVQDVLQVNDFVMFFWTRIR